MSKLLIGGELVDAVKKETYEVRNPATGQVVDHAAKGSEEDVRQAVDAAEAAFKEWSDTTPEDRGKALESACDLIKERSKDIAQLLTQEQGKTLFEAGLEIHHLIHGLEFYAGLASKVRGSHVPLPQKNAYGMVVRQPIGVCGAIVPWNFPLTLMGTKLGPALAAGQHHHRQARLHHPAGHGAVHGADLAGHLRRRQEEPAQGRGELRQRTGRVGG